MSTPSSKILKKVSYCHCLRCGYDWLPRFDGVLPTSCAKCKSNLWAKPRIPTRKIRMDRTGFTKSGFAKKKKKTIVLDALAALRN